MDPTAALVTEPTQVAALLAAVLAGVFALSRLGALAKLFEVVPPIIWAYFVPMLLHHRRPHRASQGYLSSVSRRVSTWAAAPDPTSSRTRYTPAARSDLPSRTS